MSLRHILNEDPSPPLPLPAPTAASPATIINGDSASARQTSPQIQSATSSQPRRRTPRTRSRSSPPPQESDQLPSRPFTYQPVAYQGAGGWDPYSGEWVQGDIFPLGPGGNYYPEHEDHTSMSPPNGNGEAEPQVGGESFVETNGRKKRRTIAPAGDDQDYRPPGTKRVCHHFHLVLADIFDLTFGG